MKKKKRIKIKKVMNAALIQVMRKELVTALED